MCCRYSATPLQLLSRRITSQACQISPAIFEPVMPLILESQRSAARPKCPQVSLRPKILTGTRCRPELFLQTNAAASLTVDWAGICCLLCKDESRARWQGFQVPKFRFFRKPRRAPLGERPHQMLRMSRPRRRLLCLIESQMSQCLRVAAEFSVRRIRG